MIVYDLWQDATQYYSNAFVQTCIDHWNVGGLVGMSAFIPQCVERLGLAAIQERCRGDGRSPHVLCREESGTADLTELCPVRVLDVYSVRRLPRAKPQSAIVSRTRWDVAIPSRRNQLTGAARERPPFGNVSISTEGITTHHAFPAIVPALNQGQRDLYHVTPLQYVASNVLF